MTEKLLTFKCLCGEKIEFPENDLGIIGEECCCDKCDTDFTVCLRCHTINFWSGERCENCKTHFKHFLNPQEEKEEYEEYLEGAEMEEFKKEVKREEWKSYGADDEAIKRMEAMEFYQMAMEEPSRQELKIKMLEYWAKVCFINSKCE